MLIANIEAIVLEITVFAFSSSHVSQQHEGTEPSLVQIIVQNFQAMSDLNFGLLRTAVLDLYCGARQSCCPGLAADFLKIGTYYPSTQLNLD